VKVVFQTPSSNSCIKSTTNVGYGLNPNDPSFSVKAFLRNDEQLEQLKEASTDYCGHKGPWLQHALYSGIIHIASLVVNLIACTGN
jgi:hypothetical protein